MIARKNTIMTVTSKDISAAAPRRDWSLVLGRVGVVVALVAFGGIVFAINGGFSIIGLEYAASKFNRMGVVFWALVSRWAIQTPAIAGISTSLPIVPWCGVIAASLLQIVVIYRRLVGRKIPGYMLLGAVLLSLYDYTSTYYGLTATAWLARSGMIVQLSLALVITFLFELSVSLVIKELRK
jgi:hypothetical protein